MHKLIPFLSARYASGIILPFCVAVWPRTHGRAGIRLPIREYQMSKVKA